MCSTKTKLQSTDCETIDTDEWSWLPNDIVAPLLASTRRPSILIQGLSLADQSSTSFLDDQQPHQHPNPRDDAAPEQGNLDAIPDAASENTILNDVLNIAAWFLAMDHAETSVELRSGEEVIAEYRARIENLRWRHQVRDEAFDNVNHTPGSFLPPAPVTGIRRNPSFDANTQPSSRYQGNQSFSLASSSQTSRSLLDDGSFTNQPDPPWASMMTIDPRTFSDLSFCPPAPEPPAVTPGSSRAAHKSLRDNSHSNYTFVDSPSNVSGSSRTPQISEPLNDDASMRFYSDMFPQSQPASFPERRDM